MRAGDVLFTWVVNVSEPLAKFDMKVAPRFGARENSNDIVAVKFAGLITWHAQHAELVFHCRLLGA